MKYNTDYFFDMRLKRLHNKILNVVFISIYLTN